MKEPTDEELRSVQWDLVVIGRGYSSIVNCMTRYHLGRLPAKTLLVGRDDPWSNYADHPMGQHAPLLALPGYPEGSQPRLERRDEFLSSNKFGAYNQKQLEFLRTQGVLVANCVIEDALEYIQNQWLIPLNRSGTPITLTSKCVDVCTGPGPGRLFHPGSGQVFGPWTDGIRNSFAPSLMQLLRDDSGDKIAVAERFMQLTSIDNHVVVVGEGPLSASVAEHALRIGASRVTWVGRPIEMAEISFPESTRYDYLVRNASSVRVTYGKIRQAIDAGRVVNVDELKIDMSPVDERLNIVLGRVSAVSVEKVTLVRDGGFSLYALTRTTQDVFGPGTSPEKMYDSIVISASSESSESERQAAAHMLRSLPKTIAPDAPLTPIQRFGMFVGLEVPDQTLRVLGAACRNRFLLNKTLGGNSSAEETYRNWVATLSPQVRMPDHTMGITIGAASIANANEFYCLANPDNCVQTALLPDGDLRLQRSTTPAAIEDSNPKLFGYSVFPRPV